MTITVHKTPARGVERRSPQFGKALGIRTIAIGGLPAFRTADAAGCRGLKNPDVMFPLDATQRPAALAVCRPCPFKSECLAWAVTNGEYFGVWGGTTEQQRRPMTDAYRDRNKNLAGAA